MQTMMVDYFPRIHTAIAEWLACIVFMIPLKKRLPPWQQLLLYVLSFFVLMRTNRIGEEQEGFLWIVLFALGMLEMLLMIKINCSVNWIEAGYYWAHAFIAAEFAASAEWQINYYLIVSKIVQPSAQTLICMAIVYAIVFSILFVINRRVLRARNRIRVTIQELASVLVIVLGAFFISNFNFAFQDNLFTQLLGAGVLYSRTLVDFGGLVMMYAHDESRSVVAQGLELEAMENLLNRQYEQYRLFEENNKSLQRVYHDLKHQIDFTAHSIDALNDRIVQTYIESGRISEFMKTPESSAAVEATKPKPKTKTFSAYVEEWLTVYKAQSLKPTTLRGYRSMLSAHLSGVFGSMQLTDITTADVQKFLNERSHLSRKTLKLMLDFMGQVFKDAIEDGYMQTDPTASRKLVIPSTRKKEREAISMEEYQDILGNLNKLSVQDRRLMALLMLTGMRRGEALGLQWADIDWEKGLINVTRNVTFAGNQPHIGTPKTENGTRQIPIVGMLREYLEPIGEGKTFIIGGDAPITEMVLKRTYQRIAKAIDLHGATPHVFRHSFLTYAQTVVTDIKTLQAIAGHADIQTTMNRYVHQQSDRIVETGKRVTDLFVQKMCKEGSPQSLAITGIEAC